MSYNPTPKQEQAIRDWVQEVIVPLIEQVLVKKLGQAMSFAAQEVIEPPRKPLTSDEIRAAETEVDPGREDLCGWSFTEGIRWAEKHHGIKGES